MLDLCCGKKGASKAMSDRGWSVITLDNDQSFSPDILADIRTWVYQGERPDLLWASPPCNEFSREFMVWSRTGTAPDLSIYWAIKRIIFQVQPRFWILENTRGAVPYFGKPSWVIYPYYFWGFFPKLINFRFTNRRNKESFSSHDKAERAAIPYDMSLAFAISIERAITFSDVKMYDEIKGGKSGQA